MICTLRRIATINWIQPVQIFTNIRNIYCSHHHLNILPVSIVPKMLSIPDCVRGMTQLDENLFRKDVSLPVLRVKSHDLNKIRGKVRLEKYLLKKLQNIKNVMDSEDINIKLLLFDPDIVSIEDNELKNNIANEIDQVVDILPTWDVQNVSLTFDNWDARKIFKAVLPNDLDFSSFTQTGHIIHCNFRDELLPYKQIIGEILLKKVRNCRTVVNKLDGITTEYRNFDLELIAGEPSYTTAVVERGITYKMDFSKVFWNSRLQHEHERVIKLLDKNSLVFDACAGIGPFVLPAAKQKLCRVVFANDLNPESVKWMNVNIQANKLKPERIVTFNMDANEFITGPVASEISKYLSQQKSDDVLKPSGAHILMNLPAFSINFLPAFKNFLKDVVVGASSEQSLFPIWVYSYLFVKAREDVEYKWYVDKAYEMVKEKLGWADDIQDKRIDAHHVRTVSTRKEMFCMRIELLPEYIGIVNGEDPPSKRQKTN